MNEREKGFNEAIDKVLLCCSLEAGNYARLSKETKLKAFHYKALALLDFKLFLEQVFKMYVVESERN